MMDSEVKDVLYEKVYFRVRKFFPTLFRDLNSSVYSDSEYLGCVKNIERWCNDWGFRDGSLEVEIVKGVGENKGFVSYRVGILRELLNC